MTVRKYISSKIYISQTKTINRLRLLGLFVVIGSFFQTNAETLRPYLSPLWFAFGNMVIGLLIVISNFFIHDVELPIELPTPTSPLDKGDVA